LIVNVGRISIVLVLAGLALAGCGRKSGLEAPPSASVAQAAPAGGPTLGEPEHGALDSERREVGAPAQNAAKKSFFLDFLVNSERPYDPPRR
jgi:predicted small lipoprotein YifL